MNMTPFLVPLLALAILGSAAPVAAEPTCPSWQDCVYQASDKLDTDCTTLTCHRDKAVARMDDKGTRTLAHAYWSWSGTNASVNDSRHEARESFHDLSWDPPYGIRSPGILLAFVAGTGFDKLDEKHGLAGSLTEDGLSRLSWSRELAMTEARGVIAISDAGYSTLADLLLEAWHDTCRVYNGQECRSGPLPPL